MPHIHEKVDFTVEVFIVCGDKVFLRKHDKYKIWLAVGGHIELDEDPIQAAIREVEEETGLKINIYGEKPEFTNVGEFKELIAPVSLNRHRINDKHEHVTLVYFAKTNDMEIAPQYGGDLSDEYKWFSLEELDDPSYNFRENIQFYAKKAIERLNGQ